MKYAVLIMALFSASPVYALPTPGEFLSHHHMPLLVRVSADSDLRIKLLRGGKVEGESSKKTIGSWRVEQSTLKIKAKLVDGKVAATKEFYYELKLIPDTTLASRAKLEVNGAKIQHTYEDDLILDVNFHGLSEASEAKCIALQNSLALTAASQGGPLGSYGSEGARKFSVSGGRLISSFVQNGVRADGSISLVSENGWDCYYRSRFIVNEKLATCGVVSFVLEHCAM